MAFWDKEKELLLIDKNKSDKIRVVLGELKNKRYIDIRLVKLVPVSEGQTEWKPSGAGVAIPEDKWDTIKAAIDNALIEDTEEEV